jgi:hypothetical protein
LRTHFADGGDLSSEIRLTTLALAALSLRFSLFLLALEDHVRRDRPGSGGWRGIVPVGYHLLANLGFRTKSGTRFGGAALCFFRRHNVSFLAASLVNLTATTPQADSFQIYQLERAPPLFVSRGRGQFLVQANGQFFQNVPTDLGRRTTARKTCKTQVKILKSRHVESQTSANYFGVHDGRRAETF